MSTNKLILCPVTMTSDIVDPETQRRYIIEFMDDLAKEKLHQCKQGTLVNLDLIPDSIIQILYNRVCVSLE